MDAYQALRETAAYFNLSTRGKIIATGEDRARLLHAMSTNHVQQLTPGQGCYVFFLTSQGKIITDANLLCFDDHFLIDVEPETRERLYQHLDHFIIADDVTLEDATPRLGTLAVEGPNAGAVLTKLGAPVPAEPYSHVAWEDATIANLSFTGQPGYWIIAPPASIPALIERLGVPQADSEAIHTIRIENGKPRYGEDMFDTTLPMETQQNHGLHFSKGCYLGQEVVERVRSRGHVNRLLTGIEIDAATPPDPQTPVEAEGQPVGKMTSSIYSPARRKVVGMAYVRTTHVAPGTALTVNGTSAITTPLAGQGRT